jgi:hypothetical protein
MFPPCVELILAVVPTVEPSPEQLIVVSTDNENIKLTGVPIGSVLEVIVNVSSQAPVYVPNAFAPPLTEPVSEPPTLWRLYFVCPRAVTK